MPQKTKQTPMMEQYLKIKAQYPDAFLFYRLGDFYELFNEDALEAARILEITLTSRNKNAEEPIPMCGVPYHAAKEYIRTLVSQGHKVAVCEQMEDPKLTKGMVKREVVQVLTPGTYIDEAGSDTKMNNYLAAVLEKDGFFDLSYTDISTGELKAARLSSRYALLNELVRLQSKEIVLPGPEEPAFLADLKEQTDIVVSFPKVSLEKEKQQEFVPLLLPENPELNPVVLLLLQYLAETQLRNLEHLQPAEYYQADEFLKMDIFARRNLELTASLRTQQKKGSLLWLLDETKTAMGARLLKQWLEKPLIDPREIAQRQGKTASLMDHYFERMDIMEALRSVYDLERLVAKVSLGNVNGRDLNQLKLSLLQIPFLVQALEAIGEPEVWGETISRLTGFPELAEQIDRAIVENPPLHITEGNLIRDHYDPRLDQYRDAMNNGKQWLARLQQEEREKTGIKTLKIGYNKVFGYYIEVTRANLAQLPPGRYERKQTLANAERFITPELKEKEQLILEAEEKSGLLEHELFVELREEVKQYGPRLQRLARTVAEVDVLLSFAQTSERYHFVRPALELDSMDLTIHNGRHPVVESVIGKEHYVPNGLSLKEKENIVLITGPNMSGKSTFMRQVALTVIMNQIGCFVPAEEASLPVFDQIFTRIGAADDLYAGQSTFMVEMVETNQALQHATDRSLILFDEIGRGTATYDGMALAEAILRYLYRTSRAKTLFSTHYHELTSLEDVLPGVKNVHVGAVEKDGELVFLHKLMKGPADKSYGLHVAKLAGMPNDLLAEAETILKTLETAEAKNETVEQIVLFEEPGPGPNEKYVLDALREVVLEKCTPLEVMNLLYEWKTLLDNQ